MLSTTKEIFLHKHSSERGYSPYRWNPELERLEYWNCYEGGWKPSSRIFSMTVAQAKLRGHKVLEYKDTWAEPFTEDIYP